MIGLVDGPPMTENPVARVLTFAALHVRNDAQIDIAVGASLKSWQLM